MIFIFDCVTVETENWLNFAKSLQNVYLIIMLATIWVNSKHLQSTKDKASFLKPIRNNIEFNAIKRVLNIFSAIVRPSVYLTTSLPSQAQCWSVQPMAKGHGFQFYIPVRISHLKT